MTPKTSTPALLVTLGFALCLTLHPLRAAAEPAGEGRIAGRLFDSATRAPLAGEVGAAYVAGGRILFTHATATPGGEFVLDGLAAGEVYLTTKLESYAVEHQTVSLRPGETKVVQLSLIRPAPLRGVVRDPAGRPLTGATVRVLYPVDTPGIGQVRTTYQWETGEAVSDARGAFALDVHPDREYVLEASHPEFLAAVSAPRKVGARGKGESVELALERGVALSGVVRDEDGNPIAGAQVRLVETGARRAAPGFISHALLEQQHRVASSGADGAFRLDGVSPTAKTVVISHPAYKPFRQAVDVAGEAAGEKARAPLRAVLQARN